MTSPDEARLRLMRVLPALRVAAKMAEIDVPGCDVTLAVTGQRKDGSGKVVATFELAPFVDDLLAVLGFEDMDALMAALDEDDGEERKSSQH